MTSYTFGDNDLAGQRLLLLAHVFAPSSTQLLAQLEGEGAGAHGVDLGCGPGETTALLERLVGLASITGLDASARLVAWAAQRAAERPQARAQFRVHDVTCAPFPVADIGFLYARFLLTHLSAPQEALATWAREVRAGGVIVLEETSAMRSAHPVFRRYYELVAQLQASYGQKMQIGEDLVALARKTPTPLAVVHATTTPIALPASIMARLHAMNIRTWRLDQGAQRAFDPAELDLLSTRLDAMAAGVEDAGEVTCELAQAVLRPGRA
jgi:trans-aconitate 2-methyltransferase